VSSALDHCIYLERCNLGSIAEYLQDVILFLEDLAPELLARAIGTSAQPCRSARIHCPSDLLRAPQSPDSAGCGLTKGEQHRRQHR
jgi:hypothetical protein